jgi:hypothetical protein
MMLERVKGAGHPPTLYAGKRLKPRWLRQKGNLLFLVPFAEIMDQNAVVE